MKGQRQINDAADVKSEYQVKVSEELADSAWDIYLSTQANGHHVQSCLWGTIKKFLGYRILRIVVSKGEKIVGGGQLLVHRVMPFVSTAYMARGPVVTEWDPFIVQIIIDELKKISKDNHYLVFALQPADNGPKYKAILEDQGFMPCWLEFAPTATILHDLTQDPEEILKGMKRQTRQNIRRSQKEGIVIREGTKEDLSTFSQLYLATSKRQGFIPYSKEYFTCLWQAFSKQNAICLLFAEWHDTPVSALLMIAFGNTVTSKTLGWSGEYARYRPNDALFWGAIQWAKNHGFDYFDMEGIDRNGAELIVSGKPLSEELLHTPAFFKLGYGGEVTLFPQSYYFVPNVLWRWPFRHILMLNCRSQSTLKNLERFRRRVV